MKLKLLFYSALAVMLAASGCKETEDEPTPNPIPTVPTTFGLENGAEITNTTITLKASGSTVEDENLMVSYVYYIGTKADDLEETPAEVTLEPYTQYFWCAQAKTVGGEGEMSEIRTFYCVPNFLLELTSDNGDGEWAAIIRWNKADKFKSVTISATPNHEGYTLESQTIEGGLDSCYFKTTKPEDDAYTHTWDDAKGIYYEPVIYTFNAEAKVQVGDKTFTFTSSIKEILLDKQSCVRDHEFNVYRVQKIGTQTWLADDLRVRTNLNGEKLGYESVMLESGAIGILYTPGYSNGQYFVPLFDGLQELLPKGYHISTHEDWLKLESFYGVETDDYVNLGGSKLSCFRLDTTYHSSYVRDRRMFVGEEQKIGTLLQCGCGVWKKTNETNQSGERTAFNAMPFGPSLEDQNTSHISAIYFAGYKEKEFCFREIWAYSTGIMRGYSSDSFTPVSIRLVKD
ncbi:MAG: hypothetical protein IKR17_06535 [Bacteroidales bacterium]|nr:hypothetical protein [Bacteroidales bacterium]